MVALFLYLGMCKPRMHGWNNTETRGHRENMGTAKAERRGGIFLTPSFPPEMFRDRLSPGGEEDKREFQDFMTIFSKGGEEHIENSLP